MAPRLTQPGPMGGARVPAAFRSVCRRSRRGVTTHLCGIRSVFRMGEIFRSVGILHYRRPDYRVSCRALFDRPRDWFVATGAIGFRDVLVMVMGLARIIDRYFAYSLS